MIVIYIIIRCDKLLYPNMSDGPEVRDVYIQDLHLSRREPAIRGHGVHMQDLHLSHRELAIRTNYSWPWTVSIVGPAAYNPPILATLILIRHSKTITLSFLLIIIII